MMTGGLWSFIVAIAIVGVVWIYNMKQATLAKIERKISNMVNDGHKQTKNQ